MRDADAVVLLRRARVRRRGLAHQPRGGARPALREVDDLRRQLGNHEKNKISLQNTKQRLADAEKSLRNVEWEHEVQMQRFAKVEAERDALRASLREAQARAQAARAETAMVLSDARDGSGDEKNAAVSADAKEERRIARESPSFAMEYI